MAKRKSHKDVQYTVDTTAAKEEVFKTFDDAAAFALSRAIASGSARLNVLVWTEAGARWYGGSDAIKQYREDPGASVFETFAIKANAQGRIA